MVKELTSEEKAMIARGLCGDIIATPPEMVWSAHARAAEIANKLGLRDELLHAAGNTAFLQRLIWEQSIELADQKVSRECAAARK